MSKELIQKIEKLKKERNAAILAHNYQLGEVQDIADHTGDSLELSRVAAKSEKKMIVFCGVYFMAETASILCPDKTILIPDPQAGTYTNGGVWIKDITVLLKICPDSANSCFAVNTF